eukprot:3371730-Pleurochrysis_carterae.AAC.1
MRAKAGASGESRLGASACLSACVSACRACECVGECEEDEAPEAVDDGELEELRSRVGVGSGDGRGVVTGVGKSAAEGVRSSERAGVGDGETDVSYVSAAGKRKPVGVSPMAELRISAGLLPRCASPLVSAEVPRDCSAKSTQARSGFLGVLLRETTASRACASEWRRRKAASSQLHQRRLKYSESQSTCTFNARPQTHFRGSGEFGKGGSGTSRVGRS